MLADKDELTRTLVWFGVLVEAVEVGTNFLS